jgi:nitrite reductase/ring-hydroxylating ferredoxin subunit
LAGAAVGGLSLPVLAACGGSSGNGAGGGGGSQRSGVLVATKDVPVGGGVILADQNVVVTRPDQGTFEGFSATCTHQGCTLANVAAGTINCGCHGSQFSITNGANVTGPLGSAAGSVPALPRVPIKVKGPNVLRA